MVYCCVYTFKYVIMEEPQNNAPSAPTTSTSYSFAIPAAIIFGFALVAAAIFFSGNTTVPAVSETETAQQEQAAADTGTVTPVNEKDHIQGNPNAPIVIVEYSDFDCPFCKNFHETMNQIMDDYGTDGQVAWVYRQFPLEQLHPSAPHIAEASECVAELGGNTAFWKFADLVFGERGVNQPTNTARLGEFASNSGVDEIDFEACLADGRTRSLVEEDFAGGLSAGAKGTPYSLILVGGQQFVINGAQPYDYVSKALDSLIEQMEGGAIEEQG